MVPKQYIFISNKWLIMKMNHNKKALVRFETMQTCEIQIQKGVRQVCVLSPQLFNLYTQFIFHKTLVEMPERVNLGVGGTLINNLRFADDAIVMAESVQDF